MKTKLEMTKLWLAVALTVFGCIMLMMGFWVSPIGIIDNSVLISFAECLTFSGTVLGIQQIYSAKHKELEQKIDKRLKNIDKKEDNVD